MYKFTFKRSSPNTVADSDPRVLVFPTAQTSRECDTYSCIQMRVNNVVGERAKSPKELRPPILSESRATPKPTPPHSCRHTNLFSNTFTGYTSACFSCPSLE